jgi:hypothetical protein
MGLNPGLQGSCPNGWTMKLLPITNITQVESTCHTKCSMMPAARHCIAIHSHSTSTCLPFQEQALTMPTSTSRWNLRAAAPERVNTAVPLPYSFALTKRMASSRLSTWRCTSGLNNQHRGHHKKFCRQRQLCPVWLMEMELSSRELHYNKVGTHWGVRWAALV